MMQHVKYTLAWLYGVAYASSIWWICVGDVSARGTGAITILSGMMIIVGTVGMIALVFTSLLNHWDDDK